MPENSLPRLFAIKELTGCGLFFVVLLNQEIVCCLKKK